MNVPRLVVGNWKLHGSREQLREFATAVRSERIDCEAVVCVPFPLLAHAQSLQGGALGWGAQDCSQHDEGAFSGEVSARMIGECGARYVIVGHSERRTRHGETDEQVAAKARRVLDAGMTPIVCIGESAADRDANLTMAVLRRQLRPVVRALGRKFVCAVLAYEPVWAIGTGSTATPGLIDDVHGSLGLALAIDAGLPPESLRILYGGSVTPGNAGAILSCTHVAGVLAGGASLHAARFTAILRAASSTPAPVC